MPLIFLFLAFENMKVGQGFKKHANLLFVGLGFDTGLGLPARISLFEL